jgi:FkbM family methyltransferase
LKTTDKIKELIQILNKQNIESLRFIDVGAKDELDFLSALSSITDIVGFEPNPIELDLLKEKYLKNDFRSTKFIGSCLSDYNGEVSFNITKRSSMSSMLEADLSNYQKHFGLYKNFENWKSNIETSNLIKTSSIKLDTFIKEKNVTIDYLKIDTQGSELKILHGAEKLLDQKRINILKIEVSTIAVYQNQVMFSDIDIYLRHKGYCLVDFITYKQNYIPSFGNNHDAKAHCSPCGDAIYVLDSEFLTDENKIKSGFLLLWLGYHSLGTFLLSDSNLSAAEREVLNAYNFTPFRKKIKQLAANLCPPVILHWFKNSH